MVQAFLSAVDGGQVHLLKFLLQKGVDAEVKDPSSQTIGIMAL